MGAVNFNIGPHYLPPWVGCILEGHPSMYFRIEEYSGLNMLVDTCLITKEALYHIPNTTMHNTNVLTALIVNLSCVDPGLIALLNLKNHTNSTIVPINRKPIKNNSGMESITN